MSDQKLFAVSAVLGRTNGNVTDFIHSLALVRATSKEEARGKHIEESMLANPGTALHGCMAIEVWDVPNDA